MMGLAASLTQPSGRIWRSTTMFGVSFQERHRQRLSFGPILRHVFEWFPVWDRPKDIGSSRFKRQIFQNLAMANYWGSIPVHVAAEHWWAKDLRWDVDSFKISSNREGWCPKKSEVTTPTQNAKRCSDIPTLGVYQGVIQATSDW